MGVCYSTEKLEHAENAKRAGGEEGIGSRSKSKKGSGKVSPLQDMANQKVAVVSNEARIEVAHSGHQDALSHAAWVGSPHEPGATHPNAGPQTVLGGTTQGESNNTSRSTLRGSNDFKGTLSANQVQNDVGAEVAVNGHGVNTNPSRVVVTLLPDQFPAIPNPSTPNQKNGTTSQREFTEEEFLASFNTLVGPASQTHRPWPSEESLLPSIPPTSAGEIHKVVAYSERLDSSRTKPQRRQSLPIGAIVPGPSRRAVAESAFLPEPNSPLRKCRSGPLIETQIRWAEDVGLSPRPSDLPLPSPSLSSSSSPPASLGSSIPWRIVNWFNRLTFAKPSPSGAARDPHFVPKPILMHSLSRNNANPGEGGLEVPSWPPPRTNLTSSEPRTGLRLEHEAIFSGVREFETMLKQVMLSKRFQTGDWIIRKHEIGREMYFLSHGSVEVLSSSGGESYGSILAGSFFGELGVVFNVLRTASVRAATTCLCWILTREKLLWLLEQFPQVADRFRLVAKQRMQNVLTRKNLQKKKNQTCSRRCSNEISQGRDRGKQMNSSFDTNRGLSVAQ